MWAVWKEVLVVWASLFALPTATLGTIAGLYWWQKRAAQRELDEPYDYWDHWSGKNP
jgi:hypothetical protein